MKRFVKTTFCLALTIMTVLSFTACGGEVTTGEEATVVDETLTLNSTATFDGWTITPVKVEESTGSDFFKPESGNVFVGVKFVIENTSEEEKTVSSLLMFDAYADDTSCDLSITATTVFGNGTTVDTTLAPGKKHEGWYGVEIPESWEELEIQVSDIWPSNTKEVFVLTK